MYVCGSDWFTQCGPVKHWVHYKSTSHSPPPNEPVSATGLETHFFECRSRMSQVSSRSGRISDFAWVTFLWSLARSSSLKTDLWSHCSKFSRSKRSVCKLSLLLCYYMEKTFPSALLNICAECNKNSVCTSETAAHNFCKCLQQDVRSILLRTIFQLFLQAVLLWKPILKRSVRVPTRFFFEKPNKMRSFLQSSVLFKAVC